MYLRKNMNLGLSALGIRSFYDLILLSTYLIVIFIRMIAFSNRIYLLEKENEESSNESYLKPYYSSMTGQYSFDLRLDPVYDRRGLYRTGNHRNSCSFKTI